MTYDLLRELSLPPIPSDLLPSLKDLQADTNTFHFHEFLHVNAVASAPITDWLISTTNLPLRRCYLQLMYPGFPRHVDTTRDVAINYLIDAGGTDVWTTFYNTYDKDEKPYFKTKVAEKTWFMLKTNMPHAVEGSVTPRYIFIINTPETQWDAITARLSNYAKL